MRIIIVTGAVALLTFLAFSWPGVAAAPNQAADSPEQSNSPPPVPTGRLLVKFKSDTAGEARSLALLRAGAEPAGQVRRLGISLVLVPPERTLEALRGLRADPAVEFAEIDHVVRAAEDDVPWGVTRVGAPDVWSSYTGAGVLVAVVDTGVQMDHPDLFDNIASGGYDCVNGDNDPSDDNGHGTSVAGVVAAVDNAEGVIGVAPDAEIIPFKVLNHEGWGYTSYVADCIGRAADQGADVINLSLSVVGRSTPLQLAVEYAEGLGSLVVAAAGNSGWYVPEYPAAYPNVVSVGALDSGDALASWSSWGKVDIAAPGVDIHSTALPDTYATGLDGTSFAAPHVAGVAALLAQQYPSATPAQLRQLLLGTATDLPAPAPDGVNDLETGAGLVDAVSASSAAGPLLSLRGDATPESELGPFGPRGLRRLRSGVTDQLDVLAGVSNPDGSPMPDKELTFTATGGDISPASTLTDSDGVGRATASSSQKGRMQVSADSIEPILHGVFEIRVAENNDEIPGNSPPSKSKFSESLDEGTDVADVWAISLKAGETLEAELSGAVDTDFFLCLYPPDTTSVFDFEVQKCSSGSGYPQSISYNVPSGQGGKWYLTAFAGFGSGSYTLSWKVKVPGVVSPLTVARRYFSPNGDGVKDTTKITFKTSRRGSLRLDIYNASGKRVKYKTLSVRNPGTYSFKWSGKTQSGRNAPSGKYTAVVKWRSVPRYSQRQTWVMLDRIRPSFSSLKDTPDPFYPRKDGYKDYSHIKYTLRERAKLQLRIFPQGSNTTVRRMTPGWRGKGPGQVKWNGRKGDGTLVTAGVYEYKFKLTDRAGNTRWTKRHPVTVSLKQIVKKSVTKTKDAAGILGGTYWYLGCGYASPDSLYYRGAKLATRATGCNPGLGDDAVLVEYRFTAPGAVRYYSITVSQYGKSSTGNHLLGGIKNWSTGGWKLLGEASSAEGWHTYPAASASGRVRSDRKIDVGMILVEERYGINRYDIRDVRVKIVYGVLQ